MLIRLLIIALFAALTAFSQSEPAGPRIEPGVAQSLAKWRAAHYSDVRYKLNLTLEKMSPVLRGTIEIRVKVTGAQASSLQTPPSGVTSPIILDWRKTVGHEKDSTIANVTLNGLVVDSVSPVPGDADRSVRSPFEESNEHLIFRDGVKAGENVIKLDFTSPILNSGSAITRYVDKEDGAEYIYSLFVPSDASTAFPVFDQPDLKARFTLNVQRSESWKVISNSPMLVRKTHDYTGVPGVQIERFAETQPISTYVFAFAAGPWQHVSVPTAVAGGLTRGTTNSTGLKTVSVISSSTNADLQPPATSGGTDPDSGPATSVYVRKSQAAKFKPHAAEVFRLNREGIKYLETYFDYKFPFPKYDIVLIPEFPFGGMEHAGATFLKESSVIFPQEPTKGDYISRANLIFHETAHQWFGDTVTMKWFDDLWLKEGFAEFMAYKTLEKVMPEYNAWKVFYERNKQAAYLTDSTKGTTPIYQEIANLSSAKSAYGNIVYRKAPSFLKQAEFYLGPDKFQIAVRAFLKKHEYANAGWEDLVKEFETASDKSLQQWGARWVKKPGLPRIFVERTDMDAGFLSSYGIFQEVPSDGLGWPVRYKVLMSYTDGQTEVASETSLASNSPVDPDPGHPFGVTISPSNKRKLNFIFPNYQDYGYGIFLLDDKSRDYVLKNIGSEKDDFLRTMMWGSLWDSVREVELDPMEYVELVIRNLASEQDESTIQSLLGRVSTAMNYYRSAPPATSGGTDMTVDLNARLEALLIDRMRNAPTLGLRITFYRALLNIASTEKARNVLKQMLKESVPPAVVGALTRKTTDSGKSASVDITLQPPATAGGTDKNAADGTYTHRAIPLRTKDRFDIVTKLLILGDPDAPALLADLEKTETSDEAKRYAYAAKAGVATAENKAKFWTDFTANKEIPESWIEAAFGPFNSVRHSQLTLPYLERALKELPNHKRNRKIFFVNGWLGSFIGGQRSEGALNIVNKFLSDNPTLDKDLRLKILENVDLIERAVKIRAKYKNN